MEKPCRFREKGGLNEHLERHESAAGPALFKQLASETELQSIVAASFDESEEVFKEATRAVPHKLIEWDGRLLRPV
jgi:hypothetical protein